MKFMTMVRGPENAGPPPKALMDAIAQLGMEAARAGVMVQMGGLMPSAMGGAKVRVENGTLTVTDGPFMETKEVIGGYAVYDCSTREDAIGWTRRFMDLHRLHWPGWSGETELRPLFEAADAPR